MNAILFMSPPFAVALLTAPAALPADATQADRLWKEATAALDARRYQDAQQPFDEFIRRYSADPRAREAQILSALCDYRRKRIVQALETWNRIVRMELMSRNASPALRLGLTHLAAHYGSERNMSEYEKVLEHLAAMFPDHELTTTEHVNAARIKAADGDYAGAAKLYATVSSHLKDNDKRDWNVARVLAERGGSVALALRAADEHLTGDSAVIAERLYKEILKRNPSEPESLEALTKLGWSLYIQGKWQEAEPLWRTVIKEAPRGSEWLARCRWHMIQLLAGPRNSMSKALELCELQISEFPNHPEGERAMLVRAWLYWTNKDWAKAKPAFEALMSAYPHTANAPPIKRYLADCEEGLGSR